MRKLLVALPLLIANILAQGDLGARGRYTMVKGDTLLDISGKFLCRPWQQPELQSAAPRMWNSDLSCFGGTLGLARVNDLPRRAPERRALRRTIKLSPKVHSTPIAEANLSIPLDRIHSFLLTNRIVDDEETFTSAPYVVAGNDGRIVSGCGDRIYARGKFNNSRSAYGVFRQGTVYVDPQTKEALGINADEIDTGEVVVVEDDVATLVLSRTTQEVRPGDRLFST